MDEQVVRQDRELEKLQEQFVCVRAVKVDSVDLSLFQFDYDQTWCAFFLNADGAIYGRYGTRAGRGDDSTTHISVASFKKSLERALEAHRGYPGNQEQFAGKRGPKPEYAVAEKIPNLPKHHCIHCHQIRESTLRTKWLEKKLTAADLWAYPLPENLGLKMEMDDGLRVQQVTPDSPAAKAGIAVGDEFVRLNGQRLLSQADIQWVLHQAPVETKLTALFRRRGELLDKTLTLSGNWKVTDLSWRASSGPGLRYGLWAVPLSETDRKRRGLAADAMALEIKNLFAPRTAPLQTAGLRVGDVIVAVDGNTTFLTETQFLTYVRLAHPPGDRLKLTVLRGSQRQELEVPLW